MILKDTEWTGIGPEIEFIYFMRDTVQPEACFSFNLRISDLSLQLQHLFVFLFLARERITKIKEDEQNIKEQTAEGCNIVHFLSKERSQDLSLSSQYHRHFHGHRFCREAEGLQLSRW